MKIAMKKTMVFAAVLLVAAGCARELEVIDLQEENLVEVIEDTPQVTVIHAGFENPETKTSIQMNDAGTVAKVLWTAGDQIMLLGMASSGGGYSRTFSTSEDGVSSADFSCSNWNPNHDCDYYYGFYPSGSYQGFTKQFVDPGLGAVIPNTQTAVPGGIAEGLNISYASTSSISETFQFRNIPSLIKFRMSGDVVETLSKIKFVANSMISGECIVFNLDGAPTFDFNKWIGDREMPSSSVLLNKPSAGFRAGVDYYIAVYPCTTEGFSMVFFNEDDEYVIKSSTKTLSLERSMITDFGTINVGNSFGDPLVTKHMTKKGNAKPVDIVVIPDGFVAGQRDTFESLAASGMDFMFNTEPYKTYKDYFNVYFIWAESEDEGASITDGNHNVITARNTAFGSRWGADSYDDMEADEDKVYGFVSAHCPEIVKDELDINSVPILVIINDTRYGGIAHTYSSGRTYCQVPYTDFGQNTLNWSFKPYMADTDEVITDNVGSHAIRTPDSVYYGIYGYGNKSHRGSWKNTLLHEFGGHSIARLTDEYWRINANGSFNYSAQSDIAGHSYSVPFGLNVTGRYNVLPEMWASIMDKRDDLVARDELYGRIGMFQGADYSIFNRWRSEMISCMYDNRPYFSTVQRALIAKRISDLAEIDFDLTAFLSTDNPRDPLRDGESSFVDDVNVRGPVMVLPMLPPPVIIEESPVEIGQ